MSEQPRATDGDDGDESEEGESTPPQLPARRLPDRLSAWGTAPDALSDLSLTDVLNDSAVRRVLDDEEEPRQQIRLRDAPPGFRAVMGKIAIELSLSYSALSRVTLAHGLAKLEAEMWFWKLRAAYERTRKDGMDGGDPDALARLDQTSRYSFQRSRPVDTTLDASRATAARISDFAIVCGIPRAKLAVVAISMSLLTLKNNRGYRNVLIAEVDAFRRYASRRTKELQLEDGS